jgi:DNA mismatch endonuclease, patch repair protein
MQAVKRRDTAPELAIRRAVHRIGLRYTVDTPLPIAKRRRGDLTFPKQRVVVFVDGCWWHGCPVHARPSGSSAGWWQTKIRRNACRDRETDELLKAEGWTALRFWEHEDPLEVAQQIWAVVRRP